ncbi:MAG: hypothetical protein R2758_00560 [Bacteroidales bacterium]
MKHFLANSNENNRAVNSSDFDERLFRSIIPIRFTRVLQREDREPS